MCSGVGKTVKSVKCLSSSMRAILGKAAQACSLSKSQEDPWAHWLASLAQLVSSRTMKDPV